MCRIVVEAALLKRLLDRSDPVLRAKVLIDLLDRPSDDTDVVAARKRIPKQPWVKATTSAHNGDGTWGRGFYHKYDGTSWVLLHLSEVGAPMDVAPIRAGVQRLIETASPADDLTGVRGEHHRGIRDGVHWKYPIACLTAHMALVLIRAGLEDHPVTRRALKSCLYVFQPGLGFGCFVTDDSLLPACVMTVPKVLKALLALPEASRTAKDKAHIKKLVAVLKKFRLYNYVPRDSREWVTWAHSASVVDKRAAKPRWIAEGRIEPRRAKDGWLRFSFPLSYNSDLLEVLLLIGEADGRRDEVIDAGLDILRSKRGADGMWKMVGGLNGKMHANLDRKGKPSPWITYRALLAFKRFGALELPADV
jgi:hypothetical protein